MIITKILMRKSAKILVVKKAKDAIPVYKFRNIQGVNERY